MDQVSNVINLQKFSAVILPGRGTTDPTGSRDYEAAYETWKMVWKQTLLELDGSDVLFSDHFTRQDYILCLFHGPICVALCCFRKANLARSAHVEDSWFKPWPSELVNQLSSEQKDGVILSWVTIHPDYRRTLSAEHVKEFSTSNRLCELTNLFLQDCSMQIAFGVTRNNRSVDKMSEYVGFSPRQQDAVLHGVNVNLITVTPDDLVVAAQKYPQAAFEMWTRRTVYLDEPMILSSHVGKRVKSLKIG